jgi:haloalkane dehalogenase
MKGTPQSSDPLTKPKEEPEVRKRAQLAAVGLSIAGLIATSAASWAGGGDGSGYDGGRETSGFIMKYDTPPEFIHHTAMEPGDLAQMYTAQVPSTEFPFEYKFVEVEGANIAYIDEGQGDPIVFLHGAPEQMYIWRNLIPYVQPYGRVIAFDHIGHGLSDKPDVKYELPDYVKYTEAFFEKMNLKNVTLVIHDWGTVIGLDYAARHPENVRGIAMMEALCAPFYPIDDRQAALKRVGKAGAVHHYELYKGDPAWDLAVNQNMFIEQVMQLHTFRELTQREMETYRDPFRKPEWRKPLYMWAREVGIEGDVPHTDKVMERYNKWLLEKTIPTLEVYGFPGEVTEEWDVRWRVERMKNHETAFIGVALHFVQEDQPEQVGRAIADWYRRNLAPNEHVWMTDPQPEFPGPGGDNSMMNLMVGR